MRTSRDLHDGWTLTMVDGPAPSGIAGREVPASVPGSVHTDLLAAGLIPDPYLDDNEAATKWIGSSSWCYRTQFDLADDGHQFHELVFEGLDTVASVALNGEPVLEARNMHRTYRVPVVPRVGSNELVVTFAAPIGHADAASLELGYRPASGAAHPYNAIRKMACSYGWDWGLVTATSGIWRPVRLEGWSDVRLASVRPVVSVDGTDGLVEVRIDLGGEPVAGTRVVARVEGTEVEAPAIGSTAAVAVNLAGVELWWPRGFGGQRLYAVEVDLVSGDGQVLDSWRGRVGFRTVELRLTPDADGTSFQFIVNGQPIFIRGVNWIPDDAFPHRVTSERYAARLDQAERANVNLLRVWGGGVFESDEFFEQCDERGLLTWQDFLFACAAYSEGEPLRSEIEAEVRDNVTRLMSHASLVLWNGNNENLWAFQDWGWQPKLDGKDWGLWYYTDLLPRLVGELDPGRPYTAASPWSGSLEIHPNDVRHGSVHQWQQWNTLDYLTYRDVVPRFSAEYGWQGPPTWSTLTRAISDDPLTPQSPGMQVHQKAAHGNDKLTNGLVPHFRLPDEMEAWHWAMSLNQAHAVRLAIEHLRSWSPRCQGSILWQLNDCWPVVSWAVVDGDGRLKPTWYAMRDAYADRLVTIQPREGGLVAVLVNDSASPWIGRLALSRVDYSGEMLGARAVDVYVESRGCLSVPIGDLAEPGRPVREVVAAAIDGERALWHFVEPRESALEPADVDVDIEAIESAVTVCVTANNFVRDVAVLPDKVAPGAEVDRMLVTLLPGESATFVVTGLDGADPWLLADPRVLRTANELVALGEGG